jgi:hypothetical protein
MSVRAQKVRLDSSNRIAIPVQKLGVEVKDRSAHQFHLRRQENMPQPSTRNLGLFAGKLWSLLSLWEGAFVARTGRVRSRIDTKAVP